MRWLLILQNYHYRIVHCKGKDNGIADYFSRVTSPDLVEFNKNNWPVNYNILQGDFTKVIAAIQAIDLWIPEFKDLKEF